MMTIDSFWPIFFIAVAIQGIFLALALIIEKNSNKTNILLSGLIFLFSISLLDNVYYWVSLYQSFPHLLGVSLSFPFLYGPLFYLFVKRTNKAEPNHRTYTHFIPWVLVVIYLSPYYLSNAEAKSVLIETWNLSLIKGFIIPVTGLISLVIYAFRSYRLIGRIEVQYNIQIIKGGHWLGKILKAFFLFVGINLIHLVLIFSRLSVKASDVIIASGLSIFIYFIGYLGLKMSKLLNGIKLDTSKYKSTTLTRKFAKAMYDRLIHHITTKKVYTDNNLKLPDLAQQLSLTPHQLSQIINEQTGQNFSEFINSYRINEALDLIHDFDRMNQLAYEVGFNNRTTFNKIFKKKTGKTPTEYKRESRAS